MNKPIYALSLALLFLSACQQPPETIYADTILVNGNVYTVDEDNARAEAIAIKDGRILLVGSNEEVQALQGDSTEVIGLQGQFVMPGFIEGHGHFSGLGQSLIHLNFLTVQSWDEIVQMVAQAAEKAKPGEWITGRGWHQEKWLEPLERSVMGYPYHDQLSEVSPNNPVVLRHASGHSLMANARAMEIAGISGETPDPFGGEIVRDSRGQAIGVFEETAMGLIGTAYEEFRATLSPEGKKQEWLRGIGLASQECLSKGITSFQDAGSSFEEIDRYAALAESGELGLRLWVMISGREEGLEKKAAAFPQVGIGNNFLTVRAIKGYMDGALGAFGAWLLQPYADKPDSYGKNTTSIDTLKKWAEIAYDNNLQYCVHAIGDRGNREVLDIFEEQFQADSSKKGLRWRVEHAQHLDTTDIPRFKEMEVIASMQGIHCTSDAPFVVRRLGAERARLGAYPWRSLLDNGVVIANGTDAPVEDVDPIECFYASVTRKRADTGMEFFPEQRMTREEAIYSYTLGNAYAAFEEGLKGSLEKGKVADIVVLSNDLSACPDEEILNTDVLMTMVDGRVKYEKP
ncbi:MAG: amidohydrolase [Lewinellaceae bacterium]|nr:amidohydrolase [Phaeodactylibacter sp.]MCB9350956.1 amidohydrolase [Lewinellaceae bacterium]